MLKFIILSLVFGAIAFLSFSPFHLWPLAYISFIGLICLIANKSKKQAMALGFCWGLSYFACGIYWVYISIKQYGELANLIALIIVAGLIVYLALFPMLFAFIVRCFDKFAPSFSFKQLVIVIPLAWQLTEFLRSSILSGFPWLDIGYSQLDSPLRSYFTLIGIHGVNLLMLITMGLMIYSLYQLIYGRHYKKAAYSIAMLFIILAIPLLSRSIKWVQIDTSRKANFVLIQGNIPQSLRWDPLLLNQSLQTYNQLSQKYLTENALIIWPETSITDIETNQYDFLQKLDQQARQHYSQIAVGIIDYRSVKLGDNQIFNTLIVLGDEQPYRYPTTNRYQKYHLVPFGEFTPFEKLLSPIAKVLNIPMSSMSRGEKKQAPLKIKGFNFTTAICYEVILSDLIWQNFSDHTDFLLTVSNDAWFGDSIGPWQHLQMAQARALEFGRPMIRSTNNGITAIINHKGEIIKQLPQFVTDTLTLSVSPTIGLTPYAYLGNIPYFLGILILLALLFIKRSQ